ncbi:MAG: type II secretion system protein N [Dokdonella sp.]|uniref:type II secretion system protein N n=1 Tax=Dokdonella sp. TaxID=2291710 RepID=UPI0032660B7D
MRLLKGFLVLVVLALIVGGIVLWTLPADVAYRYGTSYLGPVVLTGVRGTVWDGHADGVSVLGRDLGELDWHAQKAALLTGTFVTDLRVKGADIDAAGVATRTPRGTYSVRDLRFRVPAEILAPALDLGNLRLLGVISGTVTEATLSGAVLSSATGNARWTEAGVSGDAEARFSDILADFAAQPDGGIGGAVHDDGTGELAVDGTFRANVGTFDAQATLSARNGDPQVAETLRHIGELQTDGSTRLIVHGQMLKVL